jgi:agmatine deiminase
MLPSELGFRMPAEWENHESTWLSWPKDPLTFPTDIIDRVEEIYVEMIEALQGGERVDLLVNDQKTEDHVLALLSSKSNVQFHHIESQDVWMRDYGPIFVKKKEGEIAATKWIFNAWGGKYDELLKDNETGMEICRKLGVQVFEPGIVLEGGSIDTDGAGTCLTTTQCLLNKNRNPQLSKPQIESYLRNFLGFSNLIWLDEGISGDDTDGHVDDVARFVGPGKAICMVEDDPADENHYALSKNYKTLEKARTSDGSLLQITPLNMPRKVSDEEGKRLPASYANFYIGNSAVLVPIFGGRGDDLALSQVRDLFKGKKIVGINCTELVYGFGGIHCVTQQQPSGQENPRPATV